MEKAQIIDILSVGEGARIAEDDARLAPLVALARAMGSPPPDRDSPPREVMARLGDNWSALILKVLATGTFRHATLKRVIGALSAEGDISQRMLTLRLRALERDGFVSRQEHPTVPPRVDYALTPLGRGLVGQFDAILAWTEANAPMIEAARARFNG
ncbi:MAG: helix-turn-helix transcriptional regulator [Rhodobacteraceae bacterium]|nr:helix-turn-helix transcriptional regulator [Paracoccaceae bacterium]